VERDGERDLRGVVRSPALLESATSESQLVGIHRRLRSELPGVGRVAAALYDRRSGDLRTLLESADGVSPGGDLARFVEVPALGDLPVDVPEWTVDDWVLSPGRRYGRSLLELGYRSSCVIPFFGTPSVAGFLFFDSRAPAYFGRGVVEKLRLHVQLISLVVLRGANAAGTLRSAMRVVSKLSRERDPETASHLERVSRYARLIARRMAGTSGPDDEFVEHLFLFARVHDIGKLVIPDRILFKHGSLTPDEIEVMRTHVTRGAAIVDGALDEAEAALFPHAALLRNIVLYHHEAIDGSGYPEGRSGGEVPLEARIVSVADVFDALTSERPYKAPWSLEEAFDFIRAGAGSRFDTACVAAFLSEEPQVRAIHARFPDVDA